MISVIMLIYNREQYVRQAIESILNQTYSDFEFVIIDNASTDNSAAIAQEYALGDSRLRVLSNHSSNIGAGRNMGLNHIKGDYFTFIDDDDYCEPDYLAFLYGLVQTYCADIAVCGSNYDIGGDIKPKYVFDELVLCNREQAMKNFLLRKYFNSGNPTKLFRKTAKISKIRYSENSKYDDIHTMYRFFAAAGEQHIAVAAGGEPKYVFRRHAANNSEAALDFSRLTPEWIDEYLKAYRERSNYISKILPALTDLAKWSEWSYMISMIDKIKRFGIIDCSKQFEYMCRELKSNKSKFLTAKWTRDFEREGICKYV